MLYEISTSIKDLVEDYQKC